MLRVAAKKAAGRSGGKKGRPTGGRYTPKTPSPPAVGDGSAPTPQVGRRPSSPSFLVAAALAWIVCGVIAGTMLQASWKLIPAIVFVGIGLFFLRGAAQTVVRHEERLDDDT